MDQINSLEALMHLLKAYVGTGILAMPKAFSYSGIVLGMIGIVIIGIVCNACIHLLLDINNNLCEKLKVEPMDYEEIAEKTMQHSSHFGNYARSMKNVVVFFLILTQMGFCCTYFLFIGENLRKFSINNNLFGRASMDVRYYMLTILAIIIAINFIKSIKWLSKLSICANIIQLITFVIIAYNLQQNIPHISSRKAFGSEVPLFFSTTVFTFEAITVVMPLYRSVKNRNDFAKRLGVVNTALIIVIILYFIIGLMGYLKYGDDVQPVITLSLPNESLYNSLQILYSLVLLVSYSVQMNVVIIQLWHPIKQYLEFNQNNQKIIWISNYLLRTLLVIITFLLAIIIPRLDLIIAFVGALSCSFIAIIIPPVLHTIAFWEIQIQLSYKQRIWLHMRNICILIIGLLGFTTATYFSLKDIILLFL